MHCKISVWDCARNWKILFNIINKFTHTLVTLLQEKYEVYGLNIQYAIVCNQLANIHTHIYVPMYHKQSSLRFRLTVETPCLNWANFIKFRKIVAPSTLMSKCMRFPTMWYVRPAQPQISLRICLNNILTLNKYDPDVVLSRLSLHCLSNYPFKGLHYTKNYRSLVTQKMWSQVVTS